MPVIGKKLIFAGLGVVLFCGSSIVAVIADDSSTLMTTTMPVVEPASPSTTRPNRADASGPFRQMMRNRNRQNGDRPQPPLSGEEWDQLSAFMQEHSPRRMAEFDKMQDGQRKNMLKQIMVSRYETVKEAKTQDPKLYETQISKVEVEDSIFGFLRDHLRGGQLSDEDQSPFHQLVDKLVGLNFDERQQRIDSAAASLDKAREALAADKDRKDALVNDRAADLIKTNGRAKMDDRESRPSKGDRSDAAAPGKN